MRCEGQTGLQLAVAAALVPVLAAFGGVHGGEPALTRGHAQAASPNRPLASLGLRPSGKWSHWGASPSAPPRAATPKALWFGWDGPIWRYDMRTEAVEVFTALDGLPLAEGGSLERVVAAADERCAVMIRRDCSKPMVFHWAPGSPWRALPLLGQGNYVRDIAFDPNGRLLALHAVSGGCAISRFGDGKWARIGTAPDSSALVPLPDGYVVTSLGGQQEMTATFVPSAVPGKVKSAKLSGANRDHFLYHRFGDKTLCLPVATLGRIMGDDRGYELTHEGFQERLAGHYIGFDLKAGGFLTCDVLETTGEYILVKPDVADAPRIQLRFDSCWGFSPFRDTRGQLWRGDMRWDGRAWRSMAGKWSFPGPAHRAHERGFARLADDGSGWSRVNPDIPWGAVIYDSEHGTYWTATSYTGSGELRLIRAAGGKREVIRSVSNGSCTGLPSVRTSEGDWWGCLGGRAIVRLTAKGTREYPSKVYRLCRSPGGRLWCNTEGSEYARYDPNSDSFVRDEPWDDFGFTFGEWRLSYIPDVNGSALWCKADGRWATFHTPFSQNNAQVRCDPVHGDRLLVTVGYVGVLEYNATLRQWARLTENFCRASFDARGRRILSGAGVLVYDGDPWANYKPDPNEERDFAKLLKQMDSERVAVREQASARAAADLERFRDRIEQAANDHSLSLEVRVRLTDILSRADPIRPAPPPLFRAMHPALLPPS